MCNDISSSNETTIIRGIEYKICSNCKKPISGSGRTVPGHAVFVVKDFVKAGRIVPFSDQWRRLCEAVGFETLHEHHAELVRHQGTSHTLEGGEVKHIKSSKSFFRRVA